MTHRHRAERLGELFRRELASLLMGPLRDPRLDGTSITAVRATRDLSHATVYVRSEQDAAASVAALERASGFIRRELGRALHLRKIPEFRFRVDEVPEQAGRIEELLRQVRAETPAPPAGEGGADA